MTREAFEAAYKLHRPYMLILARRLVGYEDAEDIFQDAVCRLLSNHLAAMPDSLEEAKAYFITALFSGGLDHLRTKTITVGGETVQRFVSLETLRPADDPDSVDAAIFPDSRPGPDRDVDTARFLRAFKGVKLTPRQWDAVEAYYGRGLSYKQIAKMWGTSVPNVQNRLAEARVTLREQLKEWKP